MLSSPVKPTARSINIRDATMISMALLFMCNPINAHSLQLLLHKADTTFHLVPSLHIGDKRGSNILDTLPYPMLFLCKYNILPRSDDPLFYSFIFFLN